ncbi:MAG: hypothetical protein WCO03_00435 [bacterium]
MPNTLEQELKDQYKRFNKVVIWGLRNRHHTHRVIHKAFYLGLRAAEIPVVWVEDQASSRQVVQPGDLIISSEAIGKMVPKKNALTDYHLPIRDDVFYCLHNFQDIFTKKINPDQLLNLQVYANAAELNTDRWDSVTFFDREKHILYQPWGTNLLPHQFKTPTFNKHKNVYWVGSVWNNALNQGNINEISELRAVLKKHELNFVRLRFIPDFLNTFFIRQSRLAPAIGGKFQIDINYLPDRMFKNISYGHLGFSNIKKFDELFAGCTITGTTIEELVVQVLQLSEKEYKDMTSAQQLIVTKHTPYNKLLNIVKGFENFV